MEEKILNTRKNGMAVLLLTLLGYVASVALFIYSITLLGADRMLLGVQGSSLKDLLRATWAQVKPFWRTSGSTCSTGSFSASCRRRPNWIMENLLLSRTTRGVALTLLYTKAAFHGTA